MKDDEIRKTVRESYGKVALREAEEISCCGAGTTQNDVSRAIGYSEEELGAVPEGLHGQAVLRSPGLRRPPDQRVLERQ